MRPSRLRELLHYDSGTGIFVWRVSKGGVRAGNLAGTKNRDGYLKIQVDGLSCLAHRLAWLYVYGRWPEGLIDHINGIKLDNRIANLREATSSENQQNTRQANINNRFGFLGVSWNKRNNHWQARIKVNGAHKHVGCFDSAEEAYAAYLEAKLRLHPFQTIVQDETAKGNGGG